MQFLWDSVTASGLGSPGTPERFPEKFCSDTIVRTSEAATVATVTASKAPWLLQSRLPDSIFIGPLLMLDETLPHPLRQRKRVLCHTNDKNVRKRACVVVSSILFHIYES